MNDFVTRLREEGSRRYHDRHPFHARMHAGTLTRAELQAWVANRYYYQTRIPIKDALILAKCEDRAWRRVWIRRLHDQDGEEGIHEGGLAQWLALARGVGLDEAEVASCRPVFPGVWAAADAYVTFVERATLLEAVASSLTECFSPDLLTQRVAAWETHYPWVDRDALAYFRERPPRARRDADDALAFVVRQATTPSLQDACVAALVKKCEILWSLLDAIAEGTRAEIAPSFARAARPRLVSWARLRWDDASGRTLLLSPERGLLLDAPATEIVRLCDGARSVDAIIACLAARHGEAFARIERDVLEVISRLATRRLVEPV